MSLYYYNYTEMFLILSFKLIQTFKLYYYNETEMFYSTLKIVLKEGKKKK